jgi:general secretion pathway protein I
MTERSSQSGFTLVETLVALAIVGLSCAVLFKVISDNLDRTRHMQNDALAMSRVESLLAQAAAGTPRPMRGTFSDGSAWQIDVTPVPGADHEEWPVEAEQVEATVTWRDDGVTRTRRLTTLHVSPRSPRP